jgi:uncharacterized protein DUF6519
LKADLTCLSFDPFKHFSRVLMQQGRVQLDADWNEQSAILLRYLRTLAADLIGPFGGPGFSVSTLTIGTPVVPGDFAIGGGHYYVDGILCEAGGAPVAVTSFPAANAQQIQVEVWTVGGDSFQANEYLELYDDSSPASAPPQAVKISQVDYPSLTLTLLGNVPSLAKAKNPRVRRLLTYLTQPEFPVASATGALNFPAPQPLQAGDYQVYLDVWERLITYVEDDSIREVALNGPDTAARAKVVCQVKVMPTTQVKTCMTPQAIAQILQPWNRGLLKAQAKPGAAATDPCTISPDAQYRGPENQLYRVEINTGSTDAKGAATQPTFKWSRENGSVVFPIVSGGGTNTVTLETLGRDDRFGLCEGDWVEVLDDDYVLYNRSGTLLQVQSIDRTRMTVILAGTADSTAGGDLTKHPLLRRWDQKAGASEEGGLTLGADNAALIPSGTPDVWLNLEDGVQIQFVNPASSRFRTGDYWLIPARVATGDVIWPRETVTDSTGNSVTNPVAMRPDGITHHYAPLAIISVNNAGGSSLQECRASFAPLAAVIKSK